MSSAWRVEVPLPTGNGSLSLLLVRLPTAPTPRRRTAGNPHPAGLGLDEFTVNPPAIPLAKEVMRALTLEEARQAAQAAPEQDGPEAVQALVRERVAAAGEYPLADRAVGQLRA